VRPAPGSRSRTPDRSPLAAGTTWSFRQARPRITRIAKGRRTRRQAASRGARSGGSCR